MSSANRLLIASLLLCWVPNTVAQSVGTPGQASAAATAEAAATAAPKATKGKPISPAARAALRTASSQAAQLKGLSGTPRLVALERLAACYEQVAGQVASEPRAAAQAWFGAGDAWRRHASPAKAEGCYRKCLAQDDGRYEQRGWYQVGQMQRRQKQLAAAIESYGKAAVLKPGSARSHRSHLWVARCFGELGEYDKAVAAYRSALEATEKPRQVIELCNDLAKAMVRKGDLAGAESAIQCAERRARPVIEAGGVEGARVKKAFDAMSARRAVQRAQDKARGSAGDAAQLERDRAAAANGK